MSNTPEKKGVSAVDFFCIGFGAIVGVGWAVAINGWMTSCGGPIPAAIGYIVALVMMVPIALCYCELVPMLPVAGGGMAFAYKAFNETVSFISGWAAFGAFVSIIPWEAIQITDVLGYLIPGIKTGPILYKVAGEPIYLITIIIGTVASLLLFALNMRGLAAAASVQKILCFILVGAAVIGAIASLIGGNADNWKPIYDVTDPTIYGNPADGLKQVSHNSMFGGILAILASAPFFLAGFETIPQGIEDAGGDVGWDKTSSFVQEYTDALSGLEKDQVSGLVTSSYGIHIIKCTDVYNAPKEKADDGTETVKITSLDQIPSEWQETIKQSLQSQGQTTNYQNWLTEKKESSDLKINDMPSGLPYDVDMSKYQTEDPNSTDSADTNVSAADSTDGDAAASTDGSADRSASAADAEGKSSAN